MKIIDPTDADEGYMRRPSGGSGGEDRLTENVTLKFESMRGVYYPANTAQPIIFDIAASAANCR